MAPRDVRAGGLRIAVVSPLYESVPPQLYGGTERVVSYLTEELVRLGHDVTLFATADSRTRAKLRPCARMGLRLDRDCHDPLAHHFAMIDDVVAMAREFDVIHFNIDYLHFPVSRALGLDSITTLHGRLDLADLVPLYRRFADMPLVSISDAQRAPLPWARWVATVHHGIPADMLRQGEGRGGYLAFLGRISPEKRPDRAIRIARRAGILLKIAAKIDRADTEYFRTVVEPMLGPGVEFVGEIADGDKQEFLGNARALMFPIDWPEPFGLVMIEAMACGTPVIAFPCGSVPEVVDDGVTGRIVADDDEAVAALLELDRIDRSGCRRRFEERFTDTRMAEDYVRIYAQLCAHAPVRAAAA
jgi:glycosyltransferase involved in cell wall biosynthesis